MTFILEGISRTEKKVDMQFIRRFSDISFDITLAVQRW